MVSCRKDFIKNSSCRIILGHTVNGYKKERVIYGKIG